MDVKTTYNVFPPGAKLKLRFSLPAPLAEPQPRVAADVYIEHGEFKTEMAGANFLKTDIAKFVDSLHKLVGGAHGNARLKSLDGDIKIGILNTAGVVTINIGVRSSKIDDTQGPRRNITLQLTNEDLNHIDTAMLQLATEATSNG